MILDSNNFPKLCQIKEFKERAKQKGVSLTYIKNGKKYKKTTKMILKSLNKKTK